MSLGTARAAWTAAAIAIAVSLAATFTLAPPTTARVSTPAPGVPGPSMSAGSEPDQALPDATPGPPGGSGNGTDGSGNGVKARGSGVDALACSAGRNGGATAPGVTATQIKLAATVVKSGIGRAFLGDVEFGMIAVMNKMNRAGVFCGRQLTLKLVDDGWDASAGQQAIRRFITEGYFALAVVPSSEGLRLAGGKNGDIDRAQIPVVGTDGMLIHQYTDPWIWPVATSTISTMHIMVKNAYDRGARTFGIVYDQNYRFGVEGASAFRGALQRLPGSQLKASTGIQAGQSGYKNDINNRFNSACGDPASPRSTDCDFVSLLLEPDTAVTWIRDGGYLGNSGKALGVGGPQTLFGNRFAGDFARACPQPCDTQFWVWTGFKPPIPPFDSEPAVRQYVTDMQMTNSSADRVNQFVEGGYDGMLLLSQAIQRVGPNLTRAALQQVLDGMCYDSGLAPKRCYRSGNHFANISMLAFAIVLNGSDFAGWRYQQTGFIPDPWVGQDIPPED